ncbi:MAG TPA: lysylphosphatidylglycerol synthase transmembrane domain-containing protein [Dehalococcoidia bacterium]|jgi:uncharacterized membrane protein YbhN (UPF0104 family)|nr:lysylphosphatidylglycerol synthase transmembrane domain-containing protein [Dehalococcoidia bacterium]
MRATFSGRRRRILTRGRLTGAARVAVTAGLLAALVAKLSPGEIARAIGDARPWPFVSAALVLALVQGLVVVKWWWLARGRGIDAGGHLLGRSYFLANLLTTVLPTAIGGDVYRIYRVSRDASARTADVTMSVLFERATGYGAMASLGALGAAFYFGGTGAGMALLAAGLLLAPVALAAVDRVWLPRLPSGHRLRTVVRDRAELRRLVWMTLLSLGIQALYISSIALIGLAFGVEASWWYWASSVAVVAAATLIPLSLGGLGIRESGFAALLSRQSGSAAAGASVGFALGALLALVSAVALVALEAASRLETAPRRAMRASAREAEA